MKGRSALSAVLAFVLAFVALSAIGPSRAAAAGSQPIAVVAGGTMAGPEDDPLRVEVLTFGPGDHPFTAFGHDAIRIADQRTGRDVVYNFGTFAFDSPLLAIEFLRARLRYWLSRASYLGTVDAYRRENRSIEAQELDLSPSQKHELAVRLEVNARPENREYAYDYFHDNCSTRVRDVLDSVLGGRIRAASSGPGTMSLRAHALRMSASNVPLYLGLLMVLGPSTDRPISEWAEGFLPEMLQKTLRGVTIDDGGGVGVGGGPRRLVKSERVVFAPQRPPPRREPPSWAPVFLGVGLSVGLALLSLASLAGRVPAARVLFGLLSAALGGLLGLLGSVLAAAWALTPHAVVYRNENVLLFAPFAVVFVVLGVGVARGNARATRRMFLMAACALGLAAAGCALKLFPWSRQENAALVVLLVPIWLGMALGARALTLRPRAPGDVPAQVA